MVAGDKRRKVTDTSSAKTLDYLAQKVSEIQSLRNACLIALLYLSGRRISEVIGLQRRDFQVTDDHRIMFTTFNEKTYRRDRRAAYHIETQHRKLGLIYYEEITPQFSLSSLSGRALGGYVLNYLVSLKPDDYLFAPERSSKYPHISRAMGYLIVKQCFPDIWPHLLRHLRFTAYARQFRGDPLKMHPLTFHKRFESTIEYIHREETKESVHEV